MNEIEALFGTFKGLKQREKPYFPTYIYDILKRLGGILLTMFAILILMSFLSFALKPFNITITQVVEYFWRDYTYILSIPLSLPSLIGTVKTMLKTSDHTYHKVSYTYFIILIIINTGIFIFGTIPLLKLLGA